MNEVTISDIANQLGLLRVDPSIMQNQVLNLLEQVSNGKMVVVDPNNPFALGIEMATALGVNGINECQMLTRRAYPSLATNMEDLYLHMSDYDYRDVFATPSRGTFTILLDKEEVLNKTIDDPKLPGTRRLTIPRYTKIIVQDTTFTLLYSVDIKLVRHGGILITYNHEQDTPLQPLKTNVVPWDIVNIENREYLRLRLDLLQVKIDRYVAQINASSGFSKTYLFDNQFHFARAFLKTTTGWAEIRTTHTDRVYDPKVPTVVLQVLQGKLKVTVPQVYSNNGLITDAVRVDIYTTKGPLNMVLDLVEHTAYQTYWDTVATEKLDKYSALILTVSRFAVYSDDTVVGGSNSLSFDELRDRVISRSLNTEGLPITRNQLNNKLKDMGYSLVTNVDNITDRQFLATRKPPSPVTGRTVNGISAMVGILQSTLTNLELSRNVIKNNLRDTIKPGQLYELKNGKIDILADVHLDSLWNLKFSKPDYLVNLLNDNQYLYSPYYYVIDSNVNEFNCRVYHLDDPKVVSRFFHSTNSALGINVSVKDYRLSNAPNKDGYILEVALDVGKTIATLGPEFVHTQLSYVGRDRIQNRYWIEGKLVSVIDETTGLPIDDEYRYQFHIETRYDINEQDGLIPIPFKAPINLEHEFDVVTIVKDFLPPDVSPTDIDTIISKETIPNFDRNKSYIGVSHEKYTLKFGDRLNHIWNKTRTIIEPDMYETYQQDVIDTYKETIYEMDSTGSPKIYYTESTGDVSFKVLFNKGDRKLDQFGDTIYKHREGDVVIDEFGDPVVKGGGRGIQRHIDLFLLDARYLFVDQDEDILYRVQAHNAIADWCVNDMTRINSQLLERSEIFYYPIRTTGMVDVIADNDLDVTVKAEQRFNITYWLTKDKNANSSLREMIETQTINSIQKTLNSPTVSLDAIIDNLRLILKDNIVSVDVKGFLDDQYSTVTLKDSSMGLTVAKRANLLSNNQIEMVDDVTVRFTTHGT